MKTKLSVFTLLLWVGAPSTALPADVIAVEFSAGRDYFFRSDHLTSADYLQLAKDGTYSEVDVEHMFTQLSDRGSWSSQGNRLILVSDIAVRSIETSHYTVHVFDRCGVELLPQLKKKIAALKSKVADGRVTADQVERLEIRRKAKPPLRRCGPSVSMDPGFKFDVGFADAVSLDILNAAIDGYLDDRENQNRFVYDQFSYENHNFLATAAPGQRAVETTPASFKEAVDRESGWTPSFALIEIDKATYDRGVTCTYAFKVIKEMNKPCNE
jgi:hypothetical protein